MITTHMDLGSVGVKIIGIITINGAVKATIHRLGLNVFLIFLTIHIPDNNTKKEYVANKK